MNSNNNRDKDNREVASKRAEESNPMRQEHLFVSLGLNILLPSIILMKGGPWLGLDPKEGLILALAFPLSYGIYYFAARRKYNFFSIVGLISILITGGVGLLRIDKDWIAVKEAAVPSLFGLAVLVTLKTPRPLVRMFLFNDQILDVQKVEAALEETNKRSAFEKLLVICTMLLALSFLLSAALNFILAKILIVSDSGTPSFNEELGRMTIWSYPVIVVPSMIVMMFALTKLVSGIKELTGLELEDIFRQP